MSGSEASSDHANEKIQELAETVKKLNSEAERLRANLDRMHELQATLYQTNSTIIGLLEAGNELRDISMEKIIASAKR